MKTLCYLCTHQIDLAIFLISETLSRTLTVLRLSGMIMPGWSYLLKKKNQQNSSATGIMSSLVPWVCSITTEAKAWGQCGRSCFRMFTAKLLWCAWPIHHGCTVTSITHALPRTLIHWSYHDKLPQCCYRSFVQAQIHCGPAIIYHMWYRAHPVHHI